MLCIRRYIDRFQAVSGGGGLLITITPKISVILSFPKYFTGTRSTGYTTSEVM